jgi:hypothetical protein
MLIIMEVYSKNKMAAPDILETENMLKKLVVLFVIRHNLKPKPTSLTLPSSQYLKYKIPPPCKLILRALKKCKKCSTSCHNNTKVLYTITEVFAALPLKINCYFYSQ